MQGIDPHANPQQVAGQLMEQMPQRIRELS